MTHGLRTTALSLALLLAAACGGSDSGGDAEQTPQDPSVRPVERQPLTDADLMGIDRDNIGMELPWTANRVTRDPGPAPRSTIESITASGHEGFDRVTVAFAAGQGIPGYDIFIGTPDEQVTCGGGLTDVSLAGDRVMVVRIHPARAADEGGRRTVPVRTSAMDHTRFREGGLLCDDADTTVWVAGLAEGQEVRVLELREPARLVVDVH